MDGMFFWLKNGTFSNKIFSRVVEALPILCWVRMDSRDPEHLECDCLALLKLGSRVFTKAYYGLG